MSAVIEFDKYRIKSYFDKVAKSTNALTIYTGSDIASILFEAFIAFEVFIEDTRYKVSAKSDSCKVKFIGNGINEILVKDKEIIFTRMEETKTKVYKHVFETKQELIASVVWYLFCIFIDTDSFNEFSSPEYKEFRQSYI